MAIINITFASSEPNVGKKGNPLGTLVKFEELNTIKEHKYFGKPWGYWSQNPDWQLPDTEGWTVDDETGYAIPPTISKRQEWDYKAESAGKHKATMHY